MNSAHNFAKKIFGTNNISKVEKFNITFQKKYKIVVFVPESFTERVSKAMSKAGAGVIGKYSECSFRLKGIGTFKSGKGSNPFVGKRGVLERVEEIRLEMVCSHEKLNRTVSALLKVHPYEEPAYDIYEIFSGEKTKNAYAVKVELKKPVSFQKILSGVNKKIDITVIPENLKRVKVRKAVVDFSGNYSALEHLNGGIDKTIYITKIFNRPINIRLV
jgi:hypothetical protein